MRRRNAEKLIDRLDIRPEMWAKVRREKGRGIIYIKKVGDKYFYRLLQGILTYEPEYTECTREKAIEILAEYGDLQKVWFGGNA